MFILPKTSIRNSIYEVNADVNGNPVVGNERQALRRPARLASFNPHSNQMKIFTNQIPTSRVAGQAPIMEIWSCPQYQRLPLWMYAKPISTAASKARQAAQIRSEMSGLKPTHPKLMANLIGRHDICLPTLRANLINMLQDPIDIGLVATGSYLTGLRGSLRRGR